VGTFHTTAAFFSSIIDRAVEGAFRRFPTFPDELPFFQETCTKPHVEISNPVEQSQTPIRILLPNLTGSGGTNDDQEMEIEQQTPLGSHDSNNRQTKSKDLEQTTTSSLSREQSSSKPKSKKRNKKQ